MAVEVLSENNFHNYDDFLRSFDETMIYYSSSYLKFIVKQTAATPLYLISYSENSAEIKGCLPLFLKQSMDGNVLNSLPFYGSNGGVVSGNNEAKNELAGSYKALIEQYNCLSATIITSPFETEQSFYKEQLNYQFTDQRIGQITTLPGSREKLMEIFHFKTRNTVRKGLKSNLTISWEDGLNYVDFLFATHRENITAVGGQWKPWETFNNLIECFKYGSELRIYVAKLNNEPIAALLNLYFNKTVEYFTPVTVAEFRGLQPMSALIYTAMCDAVDAQYKWWNWGGTWLSQGGVYDFKSRWGTTDCPYYYYTTIKEIDRVKSMSREQLLTAYPFFYVIPFSELING